MRRISVIALGLLVSSAWTLWADEVLLKNGDRLTGSLQAIGGKMTVTGTLLGDVTVDMKDVKTLSTDMPVEIRLKDGTTIKQRILAADAGQIATEKSALLPGQKYALADVTAINSPVEWKGAVTLGFSLTRGNSETENLALGIGLLRRSDRDRITVDGGYAYGRQTDPDTDKRTTSENRWFAGLKYDYFFTDRFYGYGAVRVSQDRIADLDLRLLAGVGVGYQLVDEGDFKISTEAGVSWVYEDYENTGSSDAVALRFAYYITKDFNSRLTLFHDLQIYPAFEDFSDFFLTTQAGFRAALTKAMFAEVKAVVDHDETPAPEAEKTDLKFLISVGVTF